MAASHPLESLSKEIEGESAKLRKRLDAWRTTQLTIASHVSSHVTLQESQGLSISQERLFLPSDFDSDQRQSLGLSKLAKLESDLREGVAFDCIKSIQQCVKAIDALLADKRMHSRGQDQNTRATTQIMRATSKRATWINQYNRNREAMVALGLPSDARSFPSLSLEDTQRRSTMVKRALGDSRRVDGQLWGMSGRPNGKDVAASSSTCSPVSLDM